MSPLYIGEKVGSRVIQVGVGVVDTTAGGTTDVLFDITTQDTFPLEGGGSVLFHALYVTLRHTNGFSVGVTPIVDGFPDVEQTFQGSSATVGGDGLFTVQAFFRLRGERIACRVRQLAATDLVEAVSVASTFVPIRAAI